MKIELFSGEEDWQCLLVDGKLVEEGHSLDALQVLTALFVEGVLTFTEYTVDQTYINTYGMVDDPDHNAITSKSVYE